MEPTTPDLSPPSPRPSGRPDASPSPGRLPSSGPNRPRRSSGPPWRRRGRRCSDFSTSSSWRATRNPPAARPRPERRHHGYRDDGRRRSCWRPFTAAGGFAVTVWGKPAERMKHAERLQQIEARAAEAAVAALEGRAVALESRLDSLQAEDRQQATKLALLESTNRSLLEKIDLLKSRVTSLEAQADQDAETIAKLQSELAEARSQLSAAQASLEEWAARCCSVCKAKPKKEAAPGAQTCPIKSPDSPARPRTPGAQSNSSP